MSVKSVGGRKRMFKEMDEVLVRGINGIGKIIEINHDERCYSIKFPFFNYLIRIDSNEKNIESYSGPLADGTSVYHTLLEKEGKILSSGENWLGGITYHVGFIDKGEAFSTINSLEVIGEDNE